MKRTCGECTLCCTLVPVQEIGKLPFTRCEHLCDSGCSIYSKRPQSCQLWSCAWLLTHTLIAERPDRSHYVINPLLATLAANREDGAIIHFQAVEVWCDPAYPDAHRDPKLRAFLLTTIPRGLACVRFNKDDDNTILLVPPHLNSTGDWQERSSTSVDRLPEETARGPRDYGR